MEQKELSAQFFLSNLSHEIRTPLNGIIGYTQLLSQTKLDQNQQLYINSMNHCCIQLIELVNDILDFSKLTTGKAQLNNECFNFKEIVEEIDSAIGYRVKEKRQKLRYIYGENLPEYVIADKHKLTQVLINLVSNANKFTPIDGRILITFSAVSSTVLEIMVEDNGIGISKEDQKKLFNPFVQVQESLTKNGSGLGLAICKKLVELMGGDIILESESGQGTIFIFRIKIEPYEQYQKYVEKNGKLLKGKHVLVVDDNVDNRLLLTEILFEYGMKPIACSSAKETLRLITGKRYPFAIALVDICMPDMAGTDLAKKIREVNVDIPLIALSSIDDFFDRSNFNQVLQKPVNKLKLLDIISKILGNDDVEQYQLNEIEDVVPVKKEIKILIAEDISYNMDMLVKMLNNMGYTNIDTANDGEEAVRKIDSKYEKGDPYDILLLDLKMPKLDGFSVAEHVKNNKYIYPKIAVISASVLEYDREKCRQIGIKYFLLKPFNMTHLKTVIGKIINGTGFKS